MQAWRGFIAKFNPVTSAGGASLAYATYLGGHTANTERLHQRHRHRQRKQCLYCRIHQFRGFSGDGRRLWDRLRAEWGTCAAAHVTKLNPDGTTILWSTFVGGSKADGSDSLFFTGPIQLDGNGNIYIIGQAGAGFPHGQSCRADVQPAGPCEVTVAELDPTGAKLLFSTTHGVRGTPHRRTSRAGSRFRRQHLSGRQYHRPGPDHDSRRIPDDLQRQPGVLLPRLCR